jgi:hypothetical protein
MGAAQTSRIFRSAKRLKKDEHTPSIWLFKCNSLFNSITTFVILEKSIYDTKNGRKPSVLSKLARLARELTDPFLRVRFRAFLLDIVLANA